MPTGDIFVNAPMKFEPPNGVRFFEDLGWQPIELANLVLHARKLRRAPWYLCPFTYLPQPDPRKPMRKPRSGIIRFRHT